MNKGLIYLNTVISVVLLIAVIYLWTGKKEDTAAVQQETTAAVSNQENTGKATDAGEPVVAGNLEGLKVVYINTDTLWEQYEFVKNTLAHLEKEGKRLKSTYEAKMIKLQNDYLDYQKNGALLTLQQQKDREADMMKQQEDIKKLEEEVQNKLIIRKQEINNQINDTILAFLNRYRVKHGYDLILQYAYLNSILAATPKLDITGDVVKELNGEYRKFKK